ncbi:unnamed protein product [Musa textilis]
MQNNWVQRLCICVDNHQNLFDLRVLQIINVSYQKQDISQPQSINMCLIDVALELLFIASRILALWTFFPYKTPIQGWGVDCSQSYTSVLLPYHCFTKQEAY